MHLAHQQHIGVGMALLMEDDRRPQIPKQAGPVAAVVIAPRPVLRIRAGAAAPFLLVEGRMADPHRHLSHQVFPVVQHQSEERPLLRCREQSEQAGQGVPQAEEAKVRPAGPHVADQVSPPVFQPVLQPGGDHLGLHIELVLVLMVAILLRRPAAQHLHGLARHPVMLEQVGAQVMLPLTGEAEPLLQEAAFVLALRQLHQMAAAS